MSDSVDGGTGATAAAEMASTSASASEGPGISADRELEEVETSANATATSTSNQAPTEDPGVRAELGDPDEQESPPKDHAGAPEKTSKGKQGMSELLV